MKKEIVKLKRIEPLTYYEKHFISYNPKLHRVGWTTWASKGAYDDAIRLKDGPGGFKHLHPEDNRFGMNFDVTKFKVI